MTVEADLEHPFFVFGSGWSSASPNRTLARYNLQCNELKVGDVCISLTHRRVEFCRSANECSEAVNCVCNCYGLCIISHTEQVCLVTLPHFCSESFRYLHMRYSRFRSNSHYNKSFVATRLTPMTQRGSPASSPTQQQQQQQQEQQHSLGPSSPRSGIEVARHDDDAASTSSMPPPLPELKALKKTCPNAESRSNLRGEVGVRSLVRHSTFFQ